MANVCRARLVYVLVVVIAVFSSACLAQTNSAFRVDEQQIKFRLNDRPVLELPVVNISGKTVAGDFRLELLATDDKVESFISGTFQEEPGTTVEKIEWPLKHLVDYAPSSLGWRRLRYSFVPRKELVLPPAEGIVQLSRVLVGLFEVRLTAASQAKPGNKFPVRVRVDDPSNGRPLRGTRVELTLELGDDEENAIKQTVVTDYAGYAVHSFDLPKEIKSSEGTITAEAKRGPFSEEVDLTFQLPSKSKITLNTDKPLYQPGQVAHLRVLAFGPNKRALANTDMAVVIESEDGEEQFHEPVKTSRFGVATADWNIPLKLRLGEYAISARVKTSGDDDDYDYNAPVARASIRVSRYELPTFTVKADPDRKYYLQGQDATIKISADYLFAKPVQNATVRLVRQQDRRWDYKGQKWTAEESDPIEGTLKNGTYEAKVNLQEEFESFDPRAYSRYQDLTLAAYVTDLSTKRTEQRRFRIRLSNQPIQLYVIGSDSGSDATEPATFYVTSSYADGSPASVSGTLYFAEPDNTGNFENDPWQGGRSKALTFRTNRFGVGKVTLPRIRDRFLVRPRYSYHYYWHSQDQETYRSALLLFEAKDKKGLSGHNTENWSVWNKKTYLRVSTPQTLYHPGDELPVTVESNSPVHEVIVNVSTPAGLVASRVVQLLHGRAELTFDYQKQLRGEVEITAFALTSAEGDDRALSGTAHVIYPALQDLKVDLRMVKTSYRPGETASSDFRVRTPEGASVESALGVLVFDRAVAERVRTDEEFGRPYGYSIYDYWDQNYVGKIADIGQRDLLGLDANQPFSAELQLLAEALMYSARYSWWSGNVRMTGGENYALAAGQIFAKSMMKSLQPVRDALEKVCKEESRYPKNDEQLKSILTRNDIQLEKVLDPWGVPYRAEYSVVGTQDVLTFKSNGPDKKAKTPDDAQAISLQWTYFREVGQIIDQVVREYPSKTGKYVRDYSTLREALRTRGIETDDLRDPWGRQYSFTFETSGPYFKVYVASAGPDGIFDSQQAPSWDDVHEWTSQVHYFIAEGADLERALAEYFAKTQRFPQTEEELKPVLAAAKLEGDRLLDPWRHPYHFTFSKRSRYWDRVNISTYYDYTAAKEKRVTDVTPVTQELGYITVTSYGQENKPEHAFNVAEFSRVLAEQSSKDLQKKSNTSQGPLPSGSGAITGVVIDQSGAVVPNVTVTVMSENVRSETAKTDDRGTYLISGIPAGVYEVRFDMQGFQQTVITRVPVQMGSTTKLDATLRVGTATEMVAVEAEAPSLQTSSSETSSVVSKGLQGAPSVEKPLFTPRLRKYFPETLLWKPDVITDKRGLAHIEFPMADNITAWSMSVIASTEAGQVGVSQKELRTFQPFFVEHDPPKVLTEGDQISLPVVLRNYSEKQQSLLTELKPEPWFSMLSPAQQNVKVDAGGDASAVFTFKATARMNPGTQRVTARNTETGDAIEREVRVHPDGQEITFTTGRVLAGEKSDVEIQIPNTVIPGSIDAELRIYPNLIAHVLDAMRGIGQKPAGCAEQITSIAYVSLHALQLLKKAGVEKVDSADPRAQVLTGARKSVQDAYELLPSLQQEDGGFAYWRDKSSDVSLTAYVLRFLTGASEFIEVDPKIISKAREYLIKQQTGDGAWTSYDWRTQAPKDDPMKTAYLVRALATSGEPSDESDKTKLAESVKKALSYLDDRISEWKDPYLVGNYALAAISQGHRAHTANARDLLSRLAHEEGTATYWNLEANTTPFYGWGYTGRLETTALAVEALARLQSLNPDSAQDGQISRGLQYLLTHKDRYACWYSTQATQNVIEAMIAAMPVGNSTGADNSAVVLVNGTKVASIQLPQATEVVGPKVIAFGKELLKGNNKVEVLRAGDQAAMQTSVITSYYVPWSQSLATQTENFKSGNTRALKLNVNFNQHEAKVGEAVSCKVEAERIGFAGYGMMIAEIGLPPGAEVDRESLEKAKEGDVDGYELQPDRVVFYLWPSAGGSKFEFSFRPRFGISAMSAPSVLYDYYNPEANAAIVPVPFKVE